jgi:hypothetical protein
LPFFHGTMDRSTVRMSVIMKGQRPWLKSRWNFGRHQRPFDEVVDRGVSWQSAGRLEAAESMVACAVHCGATDADVWQTCRSTKPGATTARRDEPSSRVPSDEQGRACRKAPEWGATTAIKWALLAWSGALTDSTSLSSTLTSGASQAFRMVA